MSRLKGFRQALDEAGASMDPNPIFWGMEGRSDNEPFVLADELRLQTAATQVLDHLTNGGVAGLFSAYKMPFPR